MSKQNRLVWRDGNIYLVTEEISSIKQQQNQRYRITYKQEFMGKVLQDSYIRTVKNDYELKQAINALYEDPHVFSVTYKKLEGSK